MQKKTLCVWPSEEYGGLSAGRVPDPDHGLGVDVGPVGRLGLLRFGVLVHLELALVQVGRRGLLADGPLESFDKKHIFCKTSEYDFCSKFTNIMTYSFLIIESHLRRILALGVVNGHVLRAALDLHLELPSHLHDVNEAGFSINLNRPQIVLDHTAPHSTVMSKMCTLGCVTPPLRITQPLAHLLDHLYVEQRGDSSSPLPPP